MSTLSCASWSGCPAVYASHEAAKDRGDLVAVKAVVAAGADVKEVDKKGRPPVVAAAPATTEGTSAATDGGDYAFLVNLLRRDTLDQYRALAVMEHHLKNPQHLAAQALSPSSFHDSMMMHRSL